MERTKRFGGGMLKFVLVGALLVGLMMGGIHLVKAYMNQSPAPAVSQTSDEHETPTPADPAPAPDPEPEQSPSANHHADLPATGPQETIGVMIMASVLAAVTAGYIQSRRLKTHFSMQL